MNFGETDASGKVFNHIMEVHQLKNDVALAKFLGVSTTGISKIRHGKQQITDGLLFRMHEKTGISAADLRALMPKPKRAKKPTAQPTA